MKPTFARETKGNTAKKAQESTCWTVSMNSSSTTLINYWKPVESKSQTQSSSESRKDSTSVSENWCSSLAGGSILKGTPTLNSNSIILADFSKVYFKINSNISIKMSNPLKLRISHPILAFSNNRRSPIRSSYRRHRGNRRHRRPSIWRPLPRFLRILIRISIRPISLSFLLLYYNTNYRYDYYFKNKVLMIKTAGPIVTPRIKPIGVVVDKSASLFPTQVFAF